MAYEALYQFYDELMIDAPYDEFISIIQLYAKKKEAILDIGCGTGRVLIPLIQEGYQVDGLDLSDAMLLVTKDKLESSHLSSHLYQDDMRKIQIQNVYQTIYSFLDTINYLTTKEDIEQTFLNIYRALKNEGYFIFDIHLLDTIKNYFDGYSYNEVDEDYTYIWNSFVEEDNDCSSVYHQFSFFLKEEDNAYRRFEEYHKQVIYPLDVYLSILENIGFKIEKLLYDFNEIKENDDIHKIIVVAKKCLT